MFKNVVSIYPVKRKWVSATLPRHRFNYDNYHANKFASRRYQ